MSNKSQRSGRKDINERIRELVSLMGSLSRVGDSITIDALSARLGVSQEDARAMMDIVCQASGEDIGGLLISSNDDETEFTLQYPGIHGIPIRLTVAETIALMHALDVAGIDEDDPLRKRLEALFSSSDVMADEVRKTLGGASSSMDSLYACAQAKVEERAISFLYQGLKDKQPRLRNVIVRSLSTDDGVWYIRALDLDLEEERTFRVDRMTDVELGAPMIEEPESHEARKPRRVCITFYDMAYYTCFEWPGIRIISEKDSVLRCDIPYYGKRSTWLLRRICAGGGSITVDDKSIMQLAQDYARKTLAGGQSPKEASGD